MSKLFSLFYNHLFFNKIYVNWAYRFDDNLNILFDKFEILAYNLHKGLLKHSLFDGVKKIIPIFIQTEGIFDNLYGFTYAKTTQKQMKCPRCGRVHLVSKILNSGEIIIGISAAVNHVRRSNATR